MTGSAEPVAALPVAPRRSASLLLVRDNPLRVLMMRRNTRGAFPSALVFPGGVLEDEDAELVGAGSEAEALRVTAIRETWEEVGVLLAHTRNGEALSAAAVPTPEEAGPAGIRGVLNAACAELSVDDLQPFGRWVTPVGGSRRFDTDFYIARAPERQEPSADGGEAVAIHWVRPEEAAQLPGEMLLLPTLMNLKRLGEYATVAEALAAAPSFSQEPVTSTVEFTADGDPVIRIPSSAGYGITEFFPRDAGHFELER